jgi:uncharacterized damage-inducible protein DinB
MTSAEREFALKKLDGSRKRLLATVRGLSHEQLEYSPAPGRWSVAECLEHIIVAEKHMLERLGGRAQQAPDPSKRSDWEGQEEAFMKQMVGRERQVQAPEVARPTGRWPIEKLLREFESTRARSREFVATVEGGLRGCFFGHLSLGQLDGYQWVLLIGAHCDRHRIQGEEVIASTGFPPQGEKKAS